MKPETARERLNRTMVERARQSRLQDKAENAVWLKRQSAVYRTKRDTLQVLTYGTR